MDIIKSKHDLNYVQICWDSPQSFYFVLPRLGITALKSSFHLSLRCWSKLLITQSMFHTEKVKNIYFPWLMSPCWLWHAHWLCAFSSTRQYWAPITQSESQEHILSQQVHTVLFVPFFCVDFGRGSAELSSQHPSFRSSIFLAPSRHHLPLSYTSATLLSFYSSFSRKPIKQQFSTYMLLCIWFYQHKHVLSVYISVIFMTYTFQEWVRPFWRAKENKCQDWLEDLTSVFIPHINYIRSPAAVPM